jgi:hypothetical protein
MNENRLTIRTNTKRKRSTGRLTAHMREAGFHTLHGSPRICDMKV